MSQSMRSEGGQQKIGAAAAEEDAEPENEPQLGDDSPTISEESEASADPEPENESGNVPEPDGEVGDEGTESEPESTTPQFTQQYSFNLDAEGGDEALEPSQESVEMDLEAFGADVDHRERETKIDQPEASSFGVDDRKSVTRGDDGEQRTLFADTSEDQQTLTGESAANQCMFGEGN